MTRIAVNGIELNVEVSGDPDGPALLLLHGFTGDVTTWEPCLDVWSKFMLVRVDIIGHGLSDSPADPQRYSMNHAVTDLLAVLDALGVGPTNVLGYSMGGRLALHFALAAPERVRMLILESASPGIEDTMARQARVQSDNALAERIEREGLEAFVDYWQSIPLFALQSRLPREVIESQRRRRLRQSPAGLANSLRGMGAGRQQYLMPRLGELEMPALLIAGALDEGYSALAQRMASLIEGSCLEIVLDAGHAVHLEQPEIFAETVRSFLESRVPSKA